MGAAGLPIAVWRVRVRVSAALLGDHDQQGATFRAACCVRPGRLSLSGVVGLGVWRVGRVSYRILQGSAGAWGLLHVKACVCADREGTRTPGTLLVTQDTQAPWTH